MPKKDTINITLDRNLWDALRRIANEESIIQDRHLSTITFLREAIETYIRLKPSETTNIRQRPVYKY